eukprot:IDg22378t1
MTLQSIQNGFQRTGLWDKMTLSAIIDPSKRLFRNEKEIGLTELLQSFNNRGRSLLRDADVGQQVTIRIATTAGAHLTSEKNYIGLALRRQIQREELRTSRAHRRAKSCRRAANSSNTHAVYLGGSARGQAGKGVRVSALRPGCHRSDAWNQEEEGAAAVRLSHSVSVEGRDGGCAMPVTCAVPGRSSAALLVPSRTVGATAE